MKTGIQKPRFTESLGLSTASRMIKNRMDAAMPERIGEKIHEAMIMPTWSQ